MTTRTTFICLLLATANFAFTQNVGIGTNQPDPSATLHVSSGNSLTNGLLVTGALNNNATVPNLGAGSRLMFYPGKAAFRAGFVDGGQWNNAYTGDRSFAAGSNTIASGAYSLAMGNKTIASGVSATALGEQTTASGNGAIAIGYLTEAQGIGSTAMGSTTTSSGDFSMAMGFVSYASGYASTALGYVTKASGEASVAIGNSTTAKALGGISVGILNDDSDNPGATASSTDRIFQIGNGISTRSNAVTVLRNGNTGIGVLDPGYRIDVAGRMRIRSGGTGGTTAGIWLNKIDNSGTLGFVGVDGNNDIGIYSNTSGWSFLVDDATGNVTVKGTVKANGVTLSSDERLKKDITPLDDVMPLLEKLNGYQYHWKDASWDASLQTGLLAQEVEKVMPELVKTDDKGMKSVNYIGLIPYMVEAVKTQQQQIEELKKLVAELIKK